MSKRNIGAMIKLCAFWQIYFPINKKKESKLKKKFF